MKEIELLEVAKELMALDDRLVLTGSLMLFVRGIDKRREAKDIDFIIEKEYASLCKIPIGLQTDLASDGCSLSFNYKGIKIDVMSGCEEPELINGVICANIEKLYMVKYSYSLQNNNDSEKHKLDLEYLGVYDKCKEQHHKDIQLICNIID